MLGLGFCKLHFSGSLANWLAAFLPVLIRGPDRFISKKNEEGVFLSLCLSSIFFSVLLLLAAAPEVVAISQKQAFASVTLVHNLRLADSPGP